MSNTEPIETNSNHQSELTQAELIRELPNDLSLADTEPLVLNFSDDHLNLDDETRNLVEETFRCNALSVERLQNLNDSNLPKSNPFNLPETIATVGKLTDHNPEYIEEEREKVVRQILAEHPSLTAETHPNPAKPSQSEPKEKFIHQQNPTIKQRLLSRAINNQKPAQTTQFTRYVGIQSTPAFLNPIKQPTFNSLMYMIESWTKARFLIDTGSEVSVIPAKMNAQLEVAPKYELKGANNSKIQT